MTIELINKSGGGATTTMTAVPLQEVSAGVTGVLVTITPSPTQSVELTALMTSTTGQGGISVAAGARTPLATSLIGGGASTTLSAGQVIIGGNIPTQRSIQARPGEAVQIIKDAGNTTQSIFYSYQFKE